MASLRSPETGGLFKMNVVSLLLHFALVAFFSLNPFPTTIKIQPVPYTVTLEPISVQEPEIQQPSPPPLVKEEKPKPIEKAKKEDIVEKVKKPQKENKELKNLQESLDEIRKKAAIDEIQRRVARREQPRGRVAPVSPPSPIVSSPKASVGRESKLNEYYSLIWSKIKEEWTIPENLVREKEMVDIETIIVIIIDRDGKLQTSLFEKKSGNDIYDQSAMRAIIKAEPFPPIPKELNLKTLEIGIRFFPD
jgi:TonB family protein